MRSTYLIIAIMTLLMRARKEVVITKKDVINKNVPFATCCEYYRPFNVRWKHRRLPAGFIPSRFLKPLYSSCEIVLKVLFFFFFLRNLFSRNMEYFTNNNICNDKILLKQIYSIFFYNVTFLNMNCNYF